MSQPCFVAGEIALWAGDMAIIKTYRLINPNAFRYIFGNLDPCIPNQRIAYLGVLPIDLEGLPAFYEELELAQIPYDTVLKEVDGDSWGEPFSRSCRITTRGLVKVTEKLDANHFIVGCYMNWDKQIEIQKKRRSKPAP